MEPLMEEEDLLTLEEFEQQLYLYVLGSFPLGWADAKRKLLADKRARLHEPSQDELQGQALSSEDYLQHLVRLLRDALPLLPPGEVQDRILATLSHYE